MRYELYKLYNKEYTQSFEHFEEKFQYMHKNIPISEQDLTYLHTNTNQLHHNHPINTDDINTIITNTKNISKNINTEKDIFSIQKKFLHTGDSMYFDTSDESNDDDDDDGDISKYLYEYDNKYFPTSTMLNFVNSKYRHLELKKMLQSSSPLEYIQNNTYLHTYIQYPDITIAIDDETLQSFFYDPKEYLKKQQIRDKNLLRSIERDKYQLFDHLTDIYTNTEENMIKNTKKISNNSHWFWKEACEKFHCIDKRSNGSVLSEVQT